MTYEEFQKLPFRFAYSLSMKDEHTATYVCSTDHRIAICDHTPYKDGEPHGKTYRHYMVDGKVYKSKKSLIKALEKYEAR